MGSRWFKSSLGLPTLMRMRAGLLTPCHGKSDSWSDALGLGSHHASDAPLFGPRKVDNALISIDSEGLRPFFGTSETEHSAKEPGRTTCHPEGRLKLALALTLGRIFVRSTELGLESMLEIVRVSFFRSSPCLTTCSEACKPFQGLL